MIEQLSVADICVNHGRRGRRVSLLRGVSFDLAAGEIAAVVGSRRDGRLTLLEVAAGLVCPDSGDVRFTDATVTSLSYSGSRYLLVESNPLGRTRISALDLGVGSRGHTPAL